MNVDFRTSGTADVEEILSMMQAFYAIDNYPIDHEVSAKLLHDFIKDERCGGSIYLIKSEEKNIGYIILTTLFSFEYGGWIAFVDELFIKEDLRRKGIGQLAINFIQSQARKQNLKLLYLEVEPHNTSAQKLYENKGFKNHKRKLLSWKPV